MDQPHLSEGLNPYTKHSRLLHYL